MTKRRSWLVYGALLTFWVVLLGWQAAEHERVKLRAQASLTKRARYVSTILGAVLRSQFRIPGPGPGVNSKARLEFALNELVKHGESNSVELLSVELLNATNGYVASAGPPIDARVKDELLKDDVASPEYWDDPAHIMALMNQVELGPNIVFTENDFRPPPPGRSTNAPGENGATNAPAVAPIVTSAVTNAPAVASERTPPEPTNAPERLSGANPDNSGRRGFPPRGGRRRYTEEEYRQRGVHGFIIVMSTESLLSDRNHDLWLRGVIGMLATVSVAGYGLAWRTLTKTSDLQVRLVRASELNTHLRDLNLAAAGLAHETRNPLNIVRGLAQMISRQPDATPEVRGRAREIIDETDRVAGQLNEFINYSRPREVRRVPTNLNAVVAEVVRALNYDVEEKKIQMRILAEPLVIEADEQLLRQALFNLVLNATQAVPGGGEIRIRAGRGNGAGAFIEISDDGPGVPPEHRAEIFKPYFTTQLQGTGLGLAVVQQIVLAHGWDIAYAPNEPAGASFRITHIKLGARS